MVQPRKKAHYAREKVEVQTLQESEKLQQEKFVHVSELEVGKVLLGNVDGRFTLESKMTAKEMESGLSTFSTIEIEEVMNSISNKSKNADLRTEMISTAKSLGASH